ncbi:Pectinesterase inhibitor domain containing protein [Parasponia andersonii]|uniref:Pectinesterase n=1 Tax=Parasponia andersonii TaxID=3476 RepID=A0A2P5AGU6_PARAD|nr:Pectinesterase inhibitor domain containing protein [Parasponia andersonii]
MNSCSKTHVLDHHFLKVPSHVFEESVESTLKVIQNLTYVITSHLHHHDDHDLDQLSHHHAISDCVDLLGSCTQLLNWSLHGIHDPKGYEQFYGTGDVRSDIRTWFSAALANQATCMEGLKDAKTIVVDNMRSSSVLENNLNELLTKSLINLLNMVQVQQNILFPRSKHYNHVLNRNITEHFRYPNVTVAQDGSGNFTKIMDAVLSAPKHSQRHYVIFVKRGLYREYVDIDSNTWNLVMIGEGRDLTVVTGNRSYGGGWPTYHTATFAVTGQGFIAINMGFENTAEPNNHQAVALRSNSDCSAFYQCKFIGHQDTLYAHSNRQFYKKCRISGTVDFIFGRAKAVFQNCHILSRLNRVEGKNTITANGRNFSESNSGFSFQNCTIFRDSIVKNSVRATTPTYLGRPWGKYSRTIFMQTYMSNIINSEGWMDWEGGTYRLDTLYYGEYKNSGPGSELGGRVKWPGFHVITKSSVASAFTVAEFIQGDSWLPFTMIPYVGGLG